MPRGFFGLADAPAPRARIPLKALCGACGLHRHCNSPKMPVAGQGRRGVMVLGEAPGKTEDAEGRPFVGKAGQLLQRYLRQLDVDLFRDCWVTNTLICRPDNNRTPTDKEIDYCLPNVLAAVNHYQPHTLILLGGTPLRSALGHYWRGEREVGAVGRWTGFTIPCQRPNLWICPTWHPSFLARQENSREYPVLERFFLHHLEQAFAKGGSPWDEVPDYAGQVQVVLDHEEAAWAVRACIKHVTKRECPLAFDYETTTLKPDGPHAQIWSCAVSYGDATIAYPWHGDAITATRELLRSPVPKIGSNLKFETRYSHAILKTGVRNWQWDTMLAAHALDCRPGITGIEFQAWVHLGQPGWDAAVAPYLKGKAPNLPNRIKECPLPKVLLYNGMDALLEWHVAQVQRKLVGLDYVKTSATQLH